MKNAAHKPFSTAPWLRAEDSSSPASTVRPSMIESLKVSFGASDHTTENSAKAGARNRNARGSIVRKSRSRLTQA